MTAEGRSRLQVRDLRVEFPTQAGVVQAVNSVSFSVEPDEILGVVGETGSGKSVTAAAILGLLRAPGRVVSGSIVFDGQELIGLSERALNRLRGRQIGLIPQNGRASLHPLLRIGDQMLRVHRTHLPQLSKREAEEQILETLRSVQLKEPARVARQYPHELSGGMAQRILIAMAFVTRPQLLIADEPTSGLDATVQLRVLDLLHEMIEQARTSAVIITHDLGVVANYSDRVAVMHAGQIVEICPVETLFDDPRHPYTIGLLNALPSARTRLPALVVRGAPPDLTAYPSGCAYHERCPLASGECVADEPTLREIRGGHLVRCHYARDVAERAAAVGAAARSETAANTQA